MLKDFGFGERDRRINVRYLGIISHLLNRNNVVSVVAAISPFEEARRMNRNLISGFVEVFCDCSVEAAAKRDVKRGLREALRGESRISPESALPMSAPPAPGLSS